MRNGAADVMLHEIDDLIDRGREFPDVQVEVQEDRPNIGVFQQIFHIVVQVRQLLYLCLILRINGDQLLVDGLEFLVCRLQLFIRREELLVDAWSSSFEVSSSSMVAWRFSFVYWSSCSRSLIR